MALESNQLDIEQVVLGSVLLSNNEEEKIEKIEQLNEDLFENEYNKLIFKTMKLLSQQNESIDVATLNLTEENIDEKYITEITTYPILSSFDTYVSKLKDSAEKRNIRNILTEGTACISKGESVDDVLNKITKKSR